MKMLEVLQPGEANDSLIGTGQLRRGRSFRFKSGRDKNPPQWGRVLEFSYLFSQLPLISTMMYLNHYFLNCCMRILLLVLL